MKKEFISIGLIILLSLLTVASISNAQGITSESHKIDISSEKDYLKIQETFNLFSDSKENHDNVTFWITDKASDINIYFNDNSIDNLHITKNANIYNCNISRFNFNKTNPAEIKIEYKVEKTLESFEKKLLRDTNNITIIYKGTHIYSAKNLKTDSKITLKLIESETALGIYTTVTIVLLVILLVVFTIYYLKKQKKFRKEEAVGVSKEYLDTKRTLLMSLLKEIEKKHRAKKISDDTYNKLKEHYKNEAVNAMRKLEDFESEVK